MSVPASRAQSEVFSASQYGGGPPVVVPAPPPPPRYAINYFVLPTFIVHVVGLACLWALWYYLRWVTGLTSGLIVALVTLFIVSYHNNHRNN